MIYLVEKYNDVNRLKAGFFSLKNKRDLLFFGVCAESERESGRGKHSGSVTCTLYQK